jgi:hypothetical protein
MPLLVSPSEVIATAGFAAAVTMIRAGTMKKALERRRPSRRCGSCGRRYGGRVCPSCTRT